MSDLKNIINKGEFGKKRRVNSKRKGSTFERRIAKLLNERFDTTEFCRTPGSGAFGSTHALPQYLIVHGDLITPQNFKYVIECKNGYDVDLDDLFKENSEFYKFIEQAKKESADCGKEWMVIYKKNRRKELIVVNSPLDFLEEWVSIKDKYYIYLLEDAIKLPESTWFN